MTLISRRKLFTAFAGSVVLAIGRVGAEPSAEPPGLYLASPQMRLELARYQFKPVEIDALILKLEAYLYDDIAFAVDPSTGKTFLSVADQILVTKGKSRRIAKPHEMMSLIAELRKIPNVVQRIRDENEFILRSDRLGLGKGLFWFNMPFEQTDLEPQLIAINFGNPT